MIRYNMKLDKFRLGNNMNWLLTLELLQASHADPMPQSALHPGYVNLFGPIPNGDAVVPSPDDCVSDVEPINLGNVDPIGVGVVSWCGHCEAKEGDVLASQYIHVEVLAVKRGDALDEGLKFCSSIKYIVI